MGIKEIIKKTPLYDFYLSNKYKRIAKTNKRIGDEEAIKIKWKKVFGKDIDLDHPKTLNEKIQWLKLNDRKDLYTTLVDKYRCRDYIEKNFGSQYLVPLLFHTTDVSQINPNNITIFPCVIKANHTSGDYLFLKSKNDIDWKMVRRKCKLWLSRDYYLLSQEWQYKNIDRCIIVEKMLLNKNGKIPNDYKLHFIEGKLAFIYCSIDREGENYRQIYDINWNLLPFTWEGKNKPQNNNIIKKPATLEEMVRIGSVIAKDMHYVRVDFYDVDGKLYCGEITLHHASGFYKFNPESFDYEYGKMVNVPPKN